LHTERLDEGPAKFKPIPMGGPWRGGASCIVIEGGSWTRKKEKKKKKSPPREKASSTVNKHSLRNKEGGSQPTGEKRREKSIKGKYEEEQGMEPYSIG